MASYRLTLSKYRNTQHLDILTKVDMVDKSELCPEDKNVKIRYGVVRMLRDLRLSLSENYRRYQ